MLYLDTPFHFQHVCVVLVIGRCLFLFSTWGLGNPLPLSTRLRTMVARLLFLCQLQFLYGECNWHTLNVRIHCPEQIYFSTSTSFCFCSFPLWWSFRKGHFSRAFLLSGPICPLALSVIYQQIFCIIPEKRMSVFWKGTLEGKMRAAVLWLWVYRTVLWFLWLHFLSFSWDTVTERFRVCEEGRWIYTMHLKYAISKVTGICSQGWKVH